MAGLSDIPASFPFHCWASSRLSFPFHCWPVLAHRRHVDVAPAHIQGLALIVGIFLILSDVRILTVGYSRKCGTPGPGRCRMCSRINPDHTGNRRGMHNNPATESTPAQGNIKSEELSFHDQNVHINHFSPFCTFCTFRQV